MGAGRTRQDGVSCVQVLPGKRHSQSVPAPAGHSLLHVIDALSLRNEGVKLKEEGG